MQVHLFYSIIISAWNYMSSEVDLMFNASTVNSRYLDVAYLE